LKDLAVDKDEREYVLDLFNMIDLDGLGSVNLPQFKEFCRKLHVNFSNRRWKNIFNDIDWYGDGEVSVDELFYYLYPDQRALREAQNRRQSLQAKKVLITNLFLIESILSVNLLRK